MVLSRGGRRVVCTEVRARKREREDRRREKDTVSRNVRARRTVNTALELEANKQQSERDVLRCVTNTDVTCEEGER